MHGTVDHFVAVARLQTVTFWVSSEYWDLHASNGLAKEEQNRREGKLKQIKQIHDNLKEAK